MDPGDLPVGSFSVQPLREKYFASPQTQITSKTPAVSFPQEGRFAVVTDVGSGMRWTLQYQARKRGRRMLMQTAKSCGPGAPTLVSSLREMTCRRRWQKSPVTGESTYKP